MTLVPGRELSHYRLIEPIGEGGMGVVWRATDTTLGRDVAIKVLPQAFAGDPERMARFEREARLLASLNHPHIASIYGLGVADGVRFLAMELVEGADLAERLSHGPMQVAEAVETARQIAEGLESAHEKGIIHRDLKPANVKLTPDGQVKVLDFGLAKALEEELPAESGPSVSASPTITSPMTAANVILGTAAYMSPEQARGRAVDRRADIWAFGCVLYECLTGGRAFAGETVSDTIAKILERDPDFSPLPAGTPARVRELLQRCLEKDPRRRLRDIGDARITLEEVLASRSASGQLLTGDAAMATGGARRASPLLLGAIAAVCLVAGAGAWALLGPRPKGAGVTRSVSISRPTGVKVRNAGMTRDGRTIVILGQPRMADGTLAPPRIYTRRIDRYEFEELRGTEGATFFLPPAKNLMYVAPASSGARQFRIHRMPLDGSAPPTGVVDYDFSWNWLSQTEGGDLLAIQSDTHLIRISQMGGAPSAPLKLDTGRPGVSRIELRGTRSVGDRGILANVVAYDARGWHYSVGVADPRTGRVRIVEEDGGNPIFSPDGNLLFSRGNTLMAVPFDRGRLVPRGAPVAVWSGLSTQFTFTPAGFDLSDDGALFYRPGQIGGDRLMAFMDPSGRIEPWAGEQRAVDGGLAISPDGRRFASSIASARGLDELWISDLDHPGYQRLGTDPDVDCTSPTWSPDGRQIAYIRYGKDERDGVYIQSAEGGEAIRVFKPRNEQERLQPFSWLPDGSALLLTMRSVGRSSIALLSVAGDEADSARLTPLVSDAFRAFSPRLSPEGRRVSYVTDESGKEQVYVAELRPDRSLGRGVQVRAAEGHDPQWSRDGTSLFFVDERERLMKVAVGAAPGISVSTPVEVLDFDKLGVALWTPLPDGRFLVGLENENEGDITKYNLVLGWTDELKRKMRAGR